MVPPSYLTSLIVCLSEILCQCVVSWLTDCVHLCATLHMWLQGGRGIYILAP